MRFDWDEKKALRNLLKHGISFEQAITAFDDPFRRIVEDVKHSTLSEKRELLIGESDIGILIVIFKMRSPGETFRIISARKANHREKELYEGNKRV